MLPDINCEPNFLKNAITEITNKDLDIASVKLSPYFQDLEKNKNSSFLFYNPIIKIQIR